MTEVAESGARVIVREALEKLTDRHVRLEELKGRTDAEHAETQRFIKAFAKALGTTEKPSLRPESSVRVGPPPGSPSPRQRFLEKVQELLVNDGAFRSAASIAYHFGANLEFTESVLNKAVERGVLRHDNGAYGAIG